VDLARSVASILANDHPHFELVVVDQSAGGSASVTLRDVRDVRLTVKAMSHAVGKSRALNLGTALTSAPIVAFTDDDCETPRTWLSRAAAVLAAEPDAAMVFGPLRAIPHDPSLVFVPTHSCDRYRRVRGATARLPEDAGVGGNMIVRRAVIDRLGGFDEWVGPGSRFRSGDDHDFVYRALRSGAVIVQDPENAVLHWGARSYASGAARRVLHNNYYGMGARHARQVRRGDILAGYVLVREGMRVARLVAANLAARNSHAGVRRLAWLARGAIEGTLTPTRLRAE
jgi:GT2 family glycosyltransferase